ncbi:MAG: hypothetical protein J1F07_08805 [Muribaculaceae bacterium]|nr:hypothetical protein [Muribaculaceae bacterium]
MKQVIRTLVLVLIASFTLISCIGGNSSSGNENYADTPESSLSEISGTWECGFYDMGSLNIMYLTIHSDGTGHVEWTYQQGFQTVTLMNENVNVRRIGNELEVSTLYPEDYEAPTVFYIKGNKLYMPNGDEMKRNYRH